MTGRHPPSPRARLANPRRSRQLCRLRLNFSASLAKDDAERQIDAWLKTIN